MKLTKPLLLFFIVLGFVFPKLFNQTSDVEFRLDINRDFGYGNGSDVRGNFSLKIYGDQQKIQSVIYYLDQKEMSKVTTAPFQLKFVTGNYPVGWHELTALVETIDGRKITTPSVKLNFVSAETESKFMSRIFIIVFVLLLVFGGIGVAAQVLSMKGAGTRAPGYQRNYSFLGGSICPRCNRPFPLHIWGINMLVGKIDRCDNCGKWALYRRYPIQVLQAAEEAEHTAQQTAEALQPQTPAGEEEKLRKMLDESKYSNQ